MLSDSVRGLPAPQIHVCLHNAIFSVSPPTRQGLPDDLFHGGSTGTGSANVFSRRLAGGITSIITTCFPE